MRSSFHTLLRSAWRLLPAVLLAFTWFIALGNLAGSERWPLCKLSHFAPHWLLLALALLCAFAIQRRWGLAIFSVLLALGFGAQVGALWIGPTRADAEKSTAESAQITLMTFNVYRGNHDHDKALMALQTARPDVLYLTEMSPAWHRGLAPLAQIYPYRLGEGNNVLLSVFPFESAKRVPVNFDTAQAAIRAAGDAMQPLDEAWRDAWRNSEILVATVRAHGRSFRVAGVHLPIPSDALRVLMQRGAALICRRELHSDPGTQAQVLMGDFNTTCFSPTFRFIVEQTGLRDSARGYGYTPTWGPRLPDEPWLPWIGIPIDQILLSNNVTVNKREVGPSLGSDHRWVTSTVQW